MLTRAKAHSKKATQTTQRASAMSPIVLIHPSGSTMSLQAEEALTAAIKAAGAASLSYTPKEIKQLAVQIQSQFEPNRPFPPAYVTALRQH